MINNNLSESQPAEYWCKKPVMINKILSATPTYLAVCIPTLFSVPLPGESMYQPEETPS